MENLLEGLLAELKRNKEVLLPAYEGIGGAGFLGVTMIKADVKMAEKAIAENDTVAMLSAYQKLKGNE